MKITYNVEQLRRKKAYEEGRDITQNQMAKESGVSQSQFSFMKTGRRHSLSVESLFRLCQYFKCGIEDIVSIEACDCEQGKESDR
jgi:DNA-binding Xre family transcriptional regulator